jgi:hypothetical protein
MSQSGLQFVTDAHSCVLQPYRTTPLVLPGAKVKKDAVTTTSYLRHHPNPKFRAPPSHYDTSAEVLMKQKVNFSYTFWQYETTKLGNFTICTLHKILLRGSNEEGKGLCVHITHIGEMM